jgi:hypothetical protein
LRLTREVSRRARETDLIGWIGKGVIGALLYDADAAGARGFADDVRRSLGTEI